MSFISRGEVGRGLGVVAGEAKQLAGHTRTLVVTAAEQVATSAGATAGA